MSKVHVMCGIAVSGKSHLAKFLTNKIDAAYISSDEIRGRWYGDALIQGDSSAILQKYAIKPAMP